MRRFGGTFATCWDRIMGLRNILTKTTAERSPTGVRSERHVTKKQLKRRHRITRLKQP